MFPGAQDAIFAAAAATLSSETYKGSNMRESFIYIIRTDTSMSTEGRR